MSAQEPPRPAPPAHPSHPAHPPLPAPVPLRCPRCGAHVAPEQDWCLECGAPARTRLAPTPNWRGPVALVALLVLLAGLVLAIAFADLTRDDGRVTAATTAAPVQPNDTATQESVPAVPSSSAPASSAAPGSG